MEAVKTLVEQEREIPAATTQPYHFVRLWENKDLQHQPAATGVFARDGWLYLGGGGGPKARISKVRVADGEVAWSVKGGSYQPSYPVSNGRVVILGTYYEGGYRALDDGAGAERWTATGANGAMSSACFAGELAFVGSYHQSFYGLYGLDVESGKIRWKTPTGESIWSTPVAYGNLVLVGCYDGYLYAMEQATGKLVWRLDCGGRIQSNPVVAGDLVFLGVDDQRVTEKYDGMKVRKRFLVIDLTEKSVLSRFETKGQWYHKIVAAEKQVFFFDRSTLHAYDVEKRSLAYKITAPPGLSPFPILTDTHVVLGMQVGGWEGRPHPVPRPPDPRPVVAYDRYTGATIGSSKGGGIEVSYSGGSKYVQEGDIVVVLGWPLSAYRLVKR